jgi:hypothetical protein
MWPNLLDLPDISIEDENQILESREGIKIFTVSVNILPLLKKIFGGKK